MRVAEHENRGTSRTYNAGNADVRERPGGQPESGSELVRAEVRGLVNERNVDFNAKLVPGRGVQVKALSHASGREVKAPSHASGRELKAAS